MQRRVEQADGDRQARHHAENLGEIAALLGEQFRKRGAAPVLAVGEDHLAHRGDARGVEEHMLGTAQPDALGTEIARDLRSEEHTSELQSLMRNSYAVFCLKKI